AAVPEHDQRERPGLAVGGVDDDVEGPLGELGLAAVGRGRACVVDPRVAALADLEGPERGDTGRVGRRRRVLGGGRRGGRRVRGGVGGRRVVVGAADGGQDEGGGEEE